MAQTQIEWTDETWNPVRGCSRISPGCGGGTSGPNKGGCYAERQAIRHARPGGSYEGLAKSTDAGPRWTGVVRLMSHLLNAPIHWRIPRRVFVNSMSDLFHEALADDDIDRVFATILACEVFEGVPAHTFQVLTKRAERMADYFAPGHDVLIRRWGKAGDGRIIVGDGSVWFSEYVDGRAEDGKVPWPLPGLWLGVSVEDRKRLPRLDALRKVPAGIRMVSFEPLLEDLGPINLAGIGWAICGGESGPGARDCHVDWLRNIIRQCASAGVAAFCKQLGAQPMDWQETWNDWRSRGASFVNHADGMGRVILSDPKGGTPEEWPADLRVREWPNAQGGAH